MTLHGRAIDGWRALFLNLACVVIRESASQEGMVDVSRRTCEGIGCIYEAKYGNPEQRAKSFCGRHKLEGMLNFEKMVRDAERG